MQTQTAPPEASGNWVWAWLALMLAVVIYGFAMAAPFATKRHDNDFKHVWLGSRALQAGLTPYPPESLLETARRSGLGPVSVNPYVYLPFTGQVLAPITAMRLPQASQAWYWINHGLLAITVALFSLTLPRGATRIWAAAGMVALLAFFHPLQRTLTAGQLTLVLTACTAATAVLLQRGLFATAGVVAAFATLFKLTPGLLLVPLWFYGGWRAMAGFFGAAGVLGAWSVWKSGWAIQLEFLPMLQSMGHGRSSWQEHGATFWKDEWNQSFNSLLTHIMVANNGKTIPWFGGPAWVANSMSIGLALFFLVLLFWSITSRQRGGTDGLAGNCPGHRDSVALAIHQTTLVALLVPSLLWDHYLVAAVPAVIWMLARGPNGLCWQTRTLILCAIIMAVPFNPESPGSRQGVGILLMSAKLWPVVIITLLCLFWVPRVENTGDEANSKPTPV